MRINVNRISLALEDKRLPLCPPLLKSGDAHPSPLVKGSAALSFVALYGAFALGLLFPPMSKAADREEFARNFQKSVTVAAGQTLHVDHRQGNVTIRTHPNRELNVQASIRVSADNRQEATQFGNDIQILVEPAASGVVVRTQYPEALDRFFSRRRNVSFSVNYDILMPEDAPLTLKSSLVTSRCRA